MVWRAYNPAKRIITGKVTAATIPRTGSSTNAITPTIATVRRLATVIGSIM